jgi:hypothetical protein
MRAATSCPTPPRRLLSLRFPSERKDTKEIENELTHNGSAQLIPKFPNLQIFKSLLAEQAAQLTQHPA